MSSVVPPRRPVVLRASRDTLVLLAAASGMALALGYSVHNRPAPTGSQTAVEQPAAGEWAGQLAALEPGMPAASTPAEPLSSDALTVPKAAMALPVVPRPSASAGKPRLCDGAPCPPAKPIAVVPEAAPVAATPETAPANRHLVARAHPIREAGLMDRLNPLNHLPDMVTRPFASAGDTIAGWVKRF